MQQIGEAAGVARSTPAYFFRSKEALYDEVLARVVARAEEALAAGRHQGEERSPDDAAASYVNALVDLLSRDQNLLCLVQRESLGDGNRVAPFLGRLAEEAVEVFTPAAEAAGISPHRLVLDMVALSWYPLAHEHTLLPALGMKPRKPAFLDEQKRHLADLLHALTRGGGRSPEHVPR
jgi:AcrR family transcriptional regulator